MTDYVITAENVTKEYRLGNSIASSQNLRETITNAFSTPFSRLRRGKPRSTTNREPASFLALQDVNFSITAGEVFGLIGRNGAGKSTLLKILSRITEPTRGRIMLRGRVGSLLEVGTGFHPELTGRENIFLSGAILGMSRAEIRRKLDDIVSFAEVEKFLETPVKRYSSGMYVRLAFAVASNLEPEILLIDEVLAVGDIQFQRKCLERMKALAAGKTTILFVSHNLGSINALCDRCLLLERGQSIAAGPTIDIVSRYLKQYSPSTQFFQTNLRLDRASIVEVSLELSTHDVATVVAMLQVWVTVRAPENQRIAIWFRIKDAFGVPVAFAGAGQFNDVGLINLFKGENRLGFTIPVESLAIGEYLISIALVLPGVSIIEELDDCLRFALDRAPREGNLSSLQQAWGYGSVELPIERTA